MSFDIRRGGYAATRRTSASSARTRTATPSFVPGPWDMVFLNRIRGLDAEVPSYFSLAGKGYEEYTIIAHLSVGRAVVFLEPDPREADRALLVYDGTLTRVISRIRQASIIKTAPISDTGLILYPFSLRGISSNFFAHNATGIARRCFEPGKETYHQ